MTSGVTQYDPIVVERVAEALWVANSKDRFGKWSSLEGLWKDKWRSDARAAIEAMGGPVGEIMPVVVMKPPASETAVNRWLGGPDVKEALHRKPAK